MGFISFLGEKRFYVHLLLAFAASVFLLWLVLKSLDSFTRHGNVYVVPDFSGLTLEELSQKKYDEFFVLEVIDSVYDKIRNKGEVIIQNPLPGSKVKEGRHIYLTIVSEKPESVFMPNLKNLSLRQALVTLETADLKTGKLIYIDYFARNAVVDQHYEGSPIEPGTPILQGSIIDLKVGKGTVENAIMMPMILGKKRSDAEKTLHYAYLNIGRETYMDGIDTANARVYKTFPDPRLKRVLQLGDSIDIWYKSGENFDFEEYLKNYETDTLIIDSVLMQNSLLENDIQ